MHSQLPVHYDAFARRLLAVVWAIAAALALAFVAAGCAPESAASAWAGTVDTLASGQISVHNPDRPLWSDEEGWILEEELRIGTVEGIGPEMFGQIADFAVDAYGRFWVFDAQAQELRVFDREGRHVRTVGRRGGGPGEFNRVIGMDWGPDANLWLADPSNNRLSVVDTTGAFVASHPTIGGVVVQPWPGGFDDAGHFYTYGVDPAVEDDFGLVMVRYGRDLQPIDSVAPPELPGEMPLFELRTESSWMRTRVPFTASLEWHLGRDGTWWGGLTGEYRIFQLGWRGDTLRSVQKEYEPLPVTASDRKKAREDLDWFIRQGGKPDLSKIPSVKPAFEDFVVDDEGNLWVQLVTADSVLAGRAFDVFDPEGRYLGEAISPFSVRVYPPPVIRGGYLYSVIENDLEVPFVVRARIVKPTGD